MNISYREQEKYLEINISGEWLKGQEMQLVTAIRDEAVRRGFIRLLIDLNELTPPKNEMARYYAGEYVAKILKPPYKSAAIGRDRLINRFGETVAKNRGADFEVFNNKKNALEWLLSEKG